jgi:hypothetical protein
MSLSDFSAVLDALDSEYKQFHGLTPATKGSENWAKLKSTHSIYAAVRIDRTHQKRVEKHIRGIVRFLREAEQVANYLSRQANTA